LEQNIDTSKAGGRLIFHIFAAFAQFERGLIIERTKAGLISARARGRKGGRPKILSDSRIDTAFKMYDSKNYSISEICQNLNIKHRTFYEYLKRRKQS